jgi:DMSO reductase anchor subunit
MSRAYRLRTVPAWDIWITTVSFFMTAALLGALAVAGLLLAGVPSGPVRDPLLRGLVLWAALLLATQLVLLPLWLSHLTGSQAAQASYERITQEYGRVLRLREALALMAIVTLSIGLLFGGARSTTVVDIGVWLAILLAVVSEILGRALFYAARVRHGI